MIIVQIEHIVSNFEYWQKAFASDPIDRKKIGVQRYSIFQLNGNPNHVIIDLEFNDFANAENACLLLKKMWGSLDGKMLINPTVRILNLVDQKII